MLVDNIHRKFKDIEKYILIGCNIDVWDNLAKTEQGRVLLWAVYYSW